MGLGDEFEIQTPDWEIESESRREEYEEVLERPIKTCLDPSLFADSGIRSSKRMVDELSSNGISFYISESFYNIMEHVVEHDGQLAYTGDKHALEFFAGNSSFEAISETAEIITNLDLITYRVTETAQDESRDVYSKFYNSLSKPEPDDEYESTYLPRGFRLADILFEEFIFGMSASPILMRIKKIKNRFSKVSDYTVEVSENYLQKFQQDIEELVEEATSKQDALLREWDRLEELSRERNNQPQDAPVRKIAVLRELVKDYPDTNYISYLVSSGAPAIGGVVGTNIAGPPGTIIGTSVGGVTGQYFADP